MEGGRGQSSVRLRSFFAPWLRHLALLANVVPVRVPVHLRLHEGAEGDDLPATLSGFRNGVFGYGEGVEIEFLDGDELPRIGRFAGMETSLNNLNWADNPDEKAMREHRQLFIDRVGRFGSTASLHEIGLVS